MFDPKALLDDLLGTRIPGTEATVGDAGVRAREFAKGNPMAAGAILAVLLGTDAGRKLTGTALKLGGLAAIGSLAYKAFRNYTSNAEPGANPTEALPPPEGSDFDPSRAPQGETEFALTLVRAMIAAANADGHIDEEERRRISDRLSLAGISAEAARFLEEEIARPLSIDELVAAARTEAQKVELYTAARLTIEPDSRAERGYLDLLAGRLGLPDALVDHVEATVSAAKAPATVPETRPPSGIDSPW